MGVPFQRALLATRRDLAGFLEGFLEGFRLLIDRYLPNE